MPKSLIVFLLCFSIAVVADDFPGSYIAETEKAIQIGAEIDVSQIPSGSLLRAELGGIPVWVYRRTNDDIYQLDNDNRELFSDPDDRFADEIIEMQLYAIVNRPLVQLLKYARQRMVFKSHRAVNSEYFVFVGIGTHSGCLLSFKTPEIKKQKNVVLHDRCTDAKYDSSGRIFKGTVKKILGDEESKYNLMLLPYRFVSPDRIKIGLLEPNDQLPEVYGSHRDKYSKLDATEMLMLAARMNDDVGIREAMANGANPHYRKLGKGSVIDAAIAGSSIEIVKMLLDLGVKPTDYSLEIATFYDRKEVVKLLAIASGSI